MRGLQESFTSAKEARWNEMEACTHGRKHGPTRLINVAFCPLSSPAAFMFVPCCQCVVFLRTMEKMTGERNMGSSRSCLQGSCGWAGRDGALFGISSSVHISHPCSNLACNPAGKSCESECLTCCVLQW